MIKNLTILSMIIFTMALVGCKSKTDTGMGEEVTENTEVNTNSSISNKIGNIFGSDDIKKNTKEVEKNKNTINKAVDDTKKMTKDLSKNIKNDWNNMKQKIK